MKEEDIRKKAAHEQYLELAAQDAARFFSDKSNFEESLCPACESKYFSAAFVKQGFQYVLCTECNTLFVTPRPTFADLNRFYEDSISTRYWINEFFKPVAEARREIIFRPRAEFITEIAAEKAGGTIGDIGAGFGIFLEEVARIWPGTRTVAIEPSPEQADICRSKGLEVQSCPLEDLEGYEGQFDILTCFELLEHLHTPSAFLKKVNTLLKPNGYLVCTTLNGEGFDIQLLWDKSKSISPPHHINFFNTRSITTLLTRCDFDAIEVSTPGKLDWDIVEGAIKANEVLLDRFWRFLSDRGSKTDKRELQDWIARNNHSSHMRAVARKSNEF